MFAVIITLCAHLLHVLLKVTHPISEYVLNFIYPLIMGKTKPLPPIEDPLLLLRATEVAVKIRKKQVSCENVMLSYIKRARQVNPLINAIVDERYIDALKDAIEVDRMLASTTMTEEEIAKETPLLGVPFTCKEMIGIKGLSQTNGIVKSKDHISDVDGHAPAFFKKAGAIPFAVTNVPEMSMWWETANLIHGMTKNPYDNTRSVGGSTGGEGAIITSAGSIIGIGTDIGGSIRIPSAFCGIYGHKPSRGIVSNWGAFPHCHMTPDRQDVRKTKHFVGTGPMCRFASDLPILLRVLSDNDKRLRLDEKVNFSSVKVYYIKEIPGILTGASVDIKKSILKAARHFEENYNVKPIPLFIDEMQQAFEIWLSKFAETESPTIRTYIANQTGSDNVWLELLKCVLRRSNHTFPTIFCGLVTDTKKDNHYYSWLKKFEALQNKFDEIFQEDAIVLFPTHPEPAPHYLLTIPKIPNICYTGIFNILGLPATAIPAGLSNGLPISIQAISGQFKDHLTIAAAMELEKVFGGWKSPCPINI